MTAFQPVATKADLDTLDPDEIVAGYLEFRKGDPEPGPNRGRAYWHGWRNRAHDAGEIPGDAAMAQLAHEVVRSTLGASRR
jgi:hypothetical protein